MVQKNAQGETRVVVLAAGQGTRMRSERAKVLHEVCGLSMLGHAQRVAHEVDARRPVVVVGAEAEAVRDACQEGEVEFVVQAEQRGTGHAVKMTQDALAGFEGDVLILYGDTPLLSCVDPFAHAGRQTRDARRSGRSHCGREHARPDCSWGFRPDREDR